MYYDDRTSSGGFGFLPSCWSLVDWPCDGGIGNFRGLEKLLFLYAERLGFTNQCTFTRLYKPLICSLWRGSVFPICLIISWARHSEDWSDFEFVSVRSNQSLLLDDEEIMS